MSGAAERFAAAIRRVGGEAVLCRPEEGLRESFPASLQPRLAAGGDDAFPTGAGAALAYTLYAPCGTAADGLRRGDLVEFRGEPHSVHRVETVCLAGAPVYRQAVLRRVTG